MLPTTELIVEKGLANYILTDQDIAQLVGAVLLENMAS